MKDYKSTPQFVYVSRSAEAFASDCLVQTEFLAKSNFIPFQYLFPLRQT